LAIHQVTWVGATAEVAQRGQGKRGQDKHLHYSRGVTVEEIRQASIALMQLVLPDRSLARKGRVAPAVADRGPH